MVDPKTPRVQQVVLPILREYLPDGVQVGSWVADVDYRRYPVVNVRRIGGGRSRTYSSGLDRPVIELTVYSADGLVEAEELYHACLDALYEAKARQKVTPAGYITHVRETMGLTQFSSLFQDTFRIQGLIQLGVKPGKDFDGA